MNIRIKDYGNIIYILQERRTHFKVHKASSKNIILNNSAEMLTKGKIHTI